MKNLLHELIGTPRERRRWHVYEHAWPYTLRKRTHTFSFIYYSDSCEEIVVPNFFQLKFTLFLRPCVAAFRALRSTNLLTLTLILYLFLFASHFKELAQFLARWLYFLCLQPGLDHVQRISHKPGQPSSGPRTNKVPKD